MRGLFMCKIFSKSKHNPKGFTLAEVLITLGIIGVVAAITIPTLISNYQKKSTVTQLKKTYAMLANAVRLAEEENGEISGWELNSKTKHNGITLFDNYLAPYLKFSKKEINGSSLQYFKPNGQREAGLAILRGRSAVYTLLSGVDILVPSGEVTSSPLITGKGTAIGMMVDINGYNTKPNRFGRDAFFILLLTEKGLALHYSDDGELGSVPRTREQLKNGPSKESYQCNKQGRGMWCGALIQRDGWTISKDYPW